MKIIKYFVVALSILLLGGCFDGENFDDNFTYTTIYPIEYASDEIYGDFSKVESIYPNEANVTDKKFTTKQLNNFAKGTTFIYNGVGNEAPIARDLLNINGEIKIIDAMKKMSFSNRIEELWLDPSNYLMICRNIKESLIDYTENIYTKEQIEENYKDIKEAISELDVELYNIGKSGNYNSLLVSNKLFKYLEKYGINVISLDPNEETSDKFYSEARKLIGNKSIRFIYILEGEKITESLNQFINDYKITKIEIPTIYTLTDEERKNGTNYIIKMKSIIDLYKKELYK